MPIQMRGNYIFVNPGEPCFLVSSNYTNYLELGRLDSNDFYFIAHIENGQHFIEALLFDDRGKSLCRIVKNHIDEIFEGKWRVVSRVDGGFAVADPSGRALMNVRLLQERVCLIEGAFYNKLGELVAKGDDNDFRILKGPAVLGRSGLSRGIVIG